MILIAALAFKEIYKPNDYHGNGKNGQNKQASFHEHGHLYDKDVVNGWSWN